MELSRDTREFLRRYGEKYLQKNDIEGLFFALENSYYSDDVAFELLDIFTNGMKINIFDYMNIVPSNLFANGDKDHKLPAQLEINGRVTRIGDNAFANSKTLKKVVIGDSVELIGKAAFKGCKSLSSLHLGNSVTAIRDEAFFDTGLKHIYLPESVTMLGRHVFPDNCYLISPRRKRKSLKFPKNELEWYKEHLVLDPKLNMTASEVEEPIEEENQ